MEKTTRILSKPFFNAHDEACLLWWDRKDKYSKFCVQELKIDSSGTAQSAHFELDTSKTPRIICFIDLTRLKMLPLFLKTCAQNNKRIVWGQRDIYNINETRLTPTIREKLIKEDHSHKGYHKGHGGPPCTICTAQHQRLLDNREREATFYYLGGNLERAYSWLQCPPQVLEHDIRPWPLGYKTTIENRYAPLALYNRLDLDSVLKQCTLENQQPLHDFVRTTKMTQYAPYQKHDGPLRMQEYLNPSDKQTKLLRISYSNPVRNYTTKPIVIAANETCTYAYLSPDRTEFAYVLKNKQNKTRCIEWYTSLSESSGGTHEGNGTYPANETLFKKIDDIGGDAVSRLSFDSSSPQIDESIGLTVYMKPKTVFDFIYMPIRYYPRDKIVHTDLEQQKDYITTRKLNTSLVHPMTWLTCAYRSMVYTKKLLYDLQG